MKSEFNSASNRALSGVDQPTFEGVNRESGRVRTAPLREVTRRLLIADDNPDIHEDFHKVLGRRSVPSTLAEAEAALLDGQEATAIVDQSYEMDCVAQGQMAVDLVERMAQRGSLYAVAFIDIRMPPGIDGIETAQRIWAIDPGLQIVFCTAYSDYSWENMVSRLGQQDGFLVLKKPFDVIEVRQAALALSEKRRLLRENELAVITLEDRVRQRTSQLERTHAKLQKEMLDRLLLEKGLRQSHKLEALGRLAAGIGHEINNPLSYTLNNLEFLLHLVDECEGSIDHDRLVAMSDAVREALLGTYRIKQIVRGTRLFSQMSEAPPSDANVVSCMRAALAIVQSELRHKAKLVEQWEEVPLVVGDPPRLEQVFVNLLLNAIQAIPKRQLSTAEISVSTKLSVEGLVEVWIRDNGCGIDAADMAQIFDPFFSTQPPGDGSGLGLWISKSVIESFGGSITVESKAGRGTAVRLRFVPVDMNARGGWDTETRSGPLEP